MIEDAHRTFARALVALAREHGMDSLTANYRLAFPRDPPWNSDEVSLRWGAGRHGVRDRIHLESVERDHLDEIAQPPGTPP